MALINSDRPYEAGSARISPMYPAAELLDREGALANLWQKRFEYWGGLHQHQTEMLDIYFGDFPSDFLDYFHELEHKHIINMIKLATDDLVGMAGQEFPLYFPAENEHDAAKRRAEKREHICYGYNAAGRKAGGLDMKGLSLMLSFYLVLCAQAVAIVCPDYKRRTPYFDWRDPRSFFPPVGYNPWGQEELDGVLFAHQMTVGEIKRRFTDEYGDLTPADVDLAVQSGGARQTTGWSGERNSTPNKVTDDDFVWVGEYYSKDHWFVATMTNKTAVLKESRTGDRGHPGICPVVAYGLLTPDLPRSHLADQVSMQAGMSRLFSQRIEFFDRTNNPLIFHSKLVGDTINYGPNAANELDTSGGTTPYVNVVAPKQPVDTDTTMGFIMGLSRMLNRNPESLQGGGDADSAKAINELRQAVSTSVKTMFWPSFIQGHPKLYSKAMQMDMNLWGQEKKKISGRTPDYHLKQRGVPVTQQYRPLSDLAGYEDDVEIEPGIMLRGYQGRLEILQLLGAKAMSRATALEQMDTIRDPEGELRRIELDELNEIVKMDLLTKAQNMELQPGAMSKIHELVAKEGVSWMEAIKQLDEKGELYVAPPAAGAMPGMPGAEGMPPELAALMGGGGGAPEMPVGPPPSLAALRGA